MPEVRNFTQGAPGEEQNQPGMFQWKANPNGDLVLMCTDNQGIGRAWVDGVGVIRAEVYGTKPMPWIASPRPWGAGPFESIAEAQHEIEEWWRAAASTVKELGL